MFNLSLGPQGRLPEQEFLMSNRLFANAKLPLFSPPSNKNPNMT
jgi:hypothetical protein